MKAQYFLLLILFFPAMAIAQCTNCSIDEHFEVDNKSGCAPLTVNILNTNRKAPKSCAAGCQVDWGQGGPLVVDLNHTFTTPGTYTVLLHYGGGLGPDAIIITVYPSIQPTFEIYTCSNNRVQVKVTDTNYDSYIINYNGEAIEDEVAKGSLPVTHTFSTPGNKVIRVRGKNTNSADNCAFSQKNVMVTTAAPAVPTIDELVVTSSSVVDLEMTTQPNVLYRFERNTNGGAFGNLGNLIDVSTASATGLNTDDNFYCFRLGALDPCAGGIPPYSNIICSADLAATAQNNANNLTWATSIAGITNFTFEKDPGTPPAATASTTTLDTDVVCGTEYCYRVISNYANGSRSFSAERCVTAISTDIPTAITNVSSVVNSSGTGVDLIWQPDAVFTAETYTVLRRPRNGSSPDPLQTITTTAFSDPDYSTNKQFCYRIDYTNACGNTSAPGREACPIFLSYSTSNNDIVLTWTDYNGWLNGVDHYELDKFDLQHGSPQTFTLSAGTTTYVDNDETDQGYYYVIRAIAVDPVDNSVSNELMAVRGLRFAYPKAFTPDNQGPVENETFRVFVIEEFIASFEMKIFNRWGEMIYSTTNLQKGWDGKFNGQPQPEGTYTFTATLKDRTGRTFKRDGAVMLLRKK